jgi:predicted PurR-regulated permease PerM
MAEVPDPNEEVVGSRRARILERADEHNVPLRTILTTVGIVVAVYLTGKVLVRLRDILMLLVVGSFLALILNPQVVWLQRWKIRRRGFAVFVVALYSIIIFAALAFAFGYPLIHALTNLANTLPKYVEKAQRGHDWIGREMRQYHVESWIKKNSSKLVSLANGLSKPALALGEGAVAGVLALVTIFAFVFLLLLEAPKIRSALLLMMTPARAARVSRVSTTVRKSATGYVLGNAVTSLCAGLVVLITLLIMGVPFAFLWALWVALVDFLPVIGAAVAGIPTVLFAFGHSPTAGIVTAVVFVVYTQVENHALNPIVMSRTVKINSLTVLVAVLVGAELGSWVGGLLAGFVGVLLAVPTAAAIQVLIHELWTRSAPTSGP